MGKISTACDRLSLGGGYLGLNVLAMMSCHSLPVGVPINCGSKATT